MNCNSRSLLELFPSGLRFKEFVQVSIKPDTSKNWQTQIITQSPFTVRGLTLSEAKWVANLQTGFTIKELSALSESSKGGQILKRLNALDLFRHIPRTEEGDSSLQTYLKQSRLCEWLTNYTDSPIEVIERIASHTFGIVGCGGTGAGIVEHLIGLGAKRFVLIDDDLVEESNFNRQFPFRHSDIGTPKVEALRNYILDRVPNADIATARSHIERSSDIQILFECVSTPILLICCADRPVAQIQCEVARAAIKLKAQCFFGSVGWSDGQMGPWLDEQSIQKGSTQKFISSMDLTARFVTENDLRPTMRGSSGTINSILVAQMGHEILLSFACPTKMKTLNQVVEFDYMTFESKTTQRF